MTDEFVFDEMTPELRAYLDCDRGRFATTQAYYDECTRLHASLPKGLLARYQRAQVAWLCRDSTVTKTKEYSSASKRYRLVVTTHNTGPRTWECSRGRVYEGDRLISTVCRNYSVFPFLFVEGHPNGHDYLVCGEDYQGQTVVELDTGARMDRTDGFCWSSYTASPSKRTLAVWGCYWAAPYELRFVDFDNPLTALPLLCEDTDATGDVAWRSDAPDTADLCGSYSEYVPLGKRESDMTDENWEDYERRREAGETGLMRTVEVPHYTWTREAQPATPPAPAA